MTPDSNSVAVAWSGLPWYAARLIRAGIASVDVRVSILGTRPEVPMKGMENVLGRPILWLNPERSYTWHELNLPVPQLFIHTAWNIPAFLSLAKVVRSSGGTVVCMIDNNFKGSTRQYLGAIVYRAWLRTQYDAVWVPGASGRQLLKFLGMPTDRIQEGLYGADATVFLPGPPVSHRAKEILFVGQLIERKGVRELLAAFRESCLAEQDWVLRLIGTGPLRPTLEGVSGVVVEDFQPEAEVALRMRGVRIFVLPSHEEHWGMVLAEAGLSGCVLLASNEVGAAHDMIGEESCRFTAGDTAELSRLLVRMAELTPEQMDKLGRTNIDRASRFGPHRWASGLSDLVARFATGGPKPASKPLN